MYMCSVLRGQGAHRIRLRCRFCRRGMLLPQERKEETFPYHLLFFAKSTAVTSQTNFVSPDDMASISQRLAAIGKHDNPAYTAEC